MLSEVAPPSPLLCTLSLLPKAKGIEVEGWSLGLALRVSITVTTACREGPV